ncbi:GGDEF domain-containing protein [Devosia sp. CAU 1758]
MTILVGLNIVIAAILAITSALSLGASIGMRGNRPMALFGLALLLGSAQTVIMSYTEGATELIAAAVLAPAAYYIVGAAICLMAPRSRPNFRVAMIAAVLSIVATLLAITGIVYFLQLLLVQLACGITVTYAAIEMTRRWRGSLLDSSIVAGLWLVTACSLVRIPLLFLHYGLDVTSEIFRNSMLETVLLSISGLSAPLLIFLLIARNIGDTLAAYQQQSERDPLTGLLNRRGVDALAATPARNGGAVIFCDIDHFKMVNDRFGHQAGDEVIRSCARILLGAGYPAGRMGGEEFSVILEGLQQQEAIDLAEMFRARMFNARHAELDEDARVSASFGVACFAPGSTPQSAFAVADQALYKAKRDGRNRVVSEPAPAAPALSEPTVLVPRHVA